MRHTLHLAFVAATLAAGCNHLFGIDEGKPRPTCAEPLIIDDMEDGNRDGRICESGGRNGLWYVFGDGTQGAQLTPRADAPFEATRVDDGSRETSQYAARFSGSGFTKWGAMMGVALKIIGDGIQPHDVSGMGGITFWMKSNVPVSVDFPTVETAQVASGGQCVDSPTETNCDNHLSFQVTAPAPGWFKYTVPFNALAQRPGGSAVWNPRHLLNIQFRTPAEAAFEVWVDDIALHYCAGPECQPTCSDPDFPISCRAMDGPRSSCQPRDTDCAAVGTWCRAPLLIDDMEDRNSTICASGGRQGWWYSIGDETPGATLTPKEGADFLQTAIPGGRGASHYAAHLTGSGFKDFGSTMGVSLNSQAAANLPYDASTHSGIKFWMKNSQPVHVLVPTVETEPPDQGGECVDGPGESNCSRYFGFKITAPSNDWVEYQVPFVAFDQADGSTAWNPAHILNVNFAPQRDTTFDVWVDDVQFYDCSASECLPTCADPAFPVQCPPNAQCAAGCRRPGTDCATFVLGCDPSNTTRAPAGGLIATFMGANGGSDIAGDVVALGDPAPTYTTDGTLHVTLNTPARSTTPAPLVVYRFQDCVDASAFRGVQFSISGSLSGCTLHYFTEDSAHLEDDGDPMSHTDHGVGRPGALTPFKTLTAAQITSVPQTLMVPFAAQSGGAPARPINPVKVTGLGWAVSADASAAGGTPPCVADLTIDDVKFY